MSDPILLQLVQIAERFDGPSRPEIPITIQVKGNRISGVLISSRNFIQLVQKNPLQEKLQKAVRRHPPESFQLFQDTADYLHILARDGANPAASCWRFRLDAVEGFTVGSLPSALSTAA
jgi:hypothetical protein